ncbi:2-polyprenylphenol hydroxylase, partial [Rickettsiaceae bacterium]|nr:2-polyprenylphenol hydroxylase [Rickettsiaceae bacterium]
LSSLHKIDNRFLDFVQKQNLGLSKQITDYRKQSSANISKNEYSEFALKLAPLLDDFLAEFFVIEKENTLQKQAHKDFDPIYECRRKFIQRYVLKKYSKEQLKEFDFQQISKSLQNLVSEITETSIATAALDYLSSLEEHQQELEVIAQYCAIMLHNNSSLALFDIPRPVDESNHIREHKIKQLKQDCYIGFDYRDRSSSFGLATTHAKYCIYCHKQNKDSCSVGMKHTQPNKYKGNERDGCPLKQKISEMNLLKSQGLNIAALAVIVIDNPLVAATGHRICNDCMQGCIYQKQDPVNITMIESNILEQVLNLPWGVEIYLLLTKWNPLNIDSPLPKANTDHNIIIAGLGPAGFALSHYMLNDGHNVTAIDGLKISPLHFDSTKLVKNWNDIKIDLSQKQPQGFGGVAEYGITNRWDKNNLTLVRLMLERRDNFDMMGGIRLGSNITTKQAFDAGFEHIALCIGAGKPRFMKEASYFAKGVRSAADFLMNLQQGGAHLKSSNSNLLVRMPAIVIGAGLTAIDSAVELLHYYPTQVEKFLNDWQNKQSPESNLTKAELEIAHEFIEHALMFRKASTSEQKLEILQKLGGVTVCYRKELKQSPAYRLNHEEIEHALAIGVKFEELMISEKIHTDQYDYVSSVDFAGNKNIKAKSVLVAIGTEANEFQDIDISNKISYFGDCNQKYAGSVVKALASAKNGYKHISEQLNAAPLKKLDSKFKPQLNAQIEQVNILSDNIVELIIHAPFAALNFKPGQFFRLQNHTTNLEKIMEPLALTGFNADKERGLISLIVLVMGRSSSLCLELKTGDKVTLMGPTGEPTNIAKNKKVILIGGGLGNAVLAPIAQALKDNNCHVTYFAGYKQAKDRFYPEKIEAISDQVIWACDEQQLNKNRATDLSFKSNIIEALIETKKIGLISDAQQAICIGSDGMMSAVSARKKELIGDIPMICSINSPMQCMMKGICGQCIQKVDNKNGYIFSCACQDQDSDIVDFNALKQRLSQNSLLEKKGF